MTSRFAGRGHGLFLVGAILLLAGCAPAPSSGRTVTPQEHDSHAPSEARPRDTRNDQPPVGGTAGAAEEAPHEHSLVTARPSEEEAYERARPVFERYCASCHTSRAGKRAALGHFTMDRYPFGGHHADEVSSAIREVLGASGQPATMPRDRPGAVQGEELRVILDWADAFDQAHAGGSHSEHHHEH